MSSLCAYREEGALPPMEVSIEGEQAHLSPVYTPPPPRTCCPHTTHMGSSNLASHVLKASTFSISMTAGEAGLGGVWEPLSCQQRDTSAHPPPVPGLSVLLRHSTPCTPGG